MTSPVPAGGFPAIEPRPDDQIERALVVVAHPDDADFGVAGTIAGWTDAGIEVTVLCCTRGEQGARPDADIEAIPALRETEQRAASAELGVSDVRFLDGHRDGWLVPGFDLQRDILRVLREVRPQRVVTQSPDRNWDRLQSSHPDHLAAGEAAVRACYPASENPFAWPELGLDPWHVGEIWVMGHPEPNHAVDITDRFDRKLAALKQHVSQTGHRAELETFLRRGSGMMAARMGLPEGRLAELFRVSPLN
ncbi:PIG-L deacetylase family protein [Enemella evansiae]|uniref:PIG-L deacetylase family protein n=1 Tax=Enemella evansiae TaxID=2016499 RepID=UPI001E28F363|nr:PIG-L deacetylase family protein [Enemella evansiae]